MNLVQVSKICTNFKHMVNKYVKVIPLTHSSVLRLREKQEEHRSCHPLINIPLRSMLIKAGVPLKKTRNRIEAERRLTSRPRGLAILHPLTLNCSSFLIASSQYNDTSAIIHSGHDDVARRLYKQQGEEVF